MGRKKTIITREDVPAEEEREPVEPEMPPPSIEEIEEANNIQSFMQSYGAELTRVTVYRVDPYRSKIIYMGSGPPDVITEDYIQESWGGGVYKVRLLNAGGKYLAERTVHIGEPPKKEPSIVYPPNAPVPPSPGEDARIEMLRLEMQNQKEILLKLIDRIGADGNGKSSITELAGVIEIVKSMVTPQSPTSIVGELVGILKQGIEIGRTGGDEGKGGWMGLAQDVLKAIPSVADTIRSAVPHSNPPSVPSEPPIQAAPEAMLKAGIAYLKAKCERGKNPEILADAIADNLDEDNNRIFLPYLNTPFEEFGKIDPAILQPPYRQWFETLYNRLKENIDALSSVGNIVGPERNDSDASSDDAAGTA